MLINSRIGHDGFPLDYHVLDAATSVPDELGVNALQRLVLLSGWFVDAISVSLLVLVVVSMILALRHL